eukprot:3781691-Rhodomonas_salina.1
MMSTCRRRGQAQGRGDTTITSSSTTVLRDSVAPGALQGFPSQCCFTLSNTRVTSNVLQLFTDCNSESDGHDFWVVTVASSCQYTYLGTRVPGYPGPTEHS